MIRGKAERWPTEAAMFEVLQEQARAAGFRCYPECCGHDLVLVAPPGLEVCGLQAGDQIAIEGKLRDSVEVLSQAVPPGMLYPLRPAQRAADFYAVLVPGARREFREVAAALGVVVLQLPPGWTPPRRAGSLERSVLLGRDTWPDEYRIGTLRQLDLPAVEVVMPAGEPAPRSITRWKIDAVRICLAASARGGELRTADFAGTAVRARTFVDRGWVVPVRREGRIVVYKLEDCETRPDRLYPEIVRALEVA